MPHRRFPLLLLFASGCLLDRSGLVGFTDAGDEPDAGRRRDAGMNVEPDACEPTAETCDGTDEDCDGEIDNGIPSVPCSTACGEGTESCVDGELVCSAPTPIPEQCNNLDDDCDGSIDGYTRDCSNACGAGVESCSGGVLAPCTAPTASEEICNGADDDCDGMVDDYSEPCSTICGSGTRSCEGGALGACTAREPSAETCNNVDDDCDGTVDGMTRPCMNSCRVGVETCTRGTFAGCTAPPPSSEVCNNVDDDCDGNVDNFSRNCTTACGTSGSQRCVAGTFERCVTSNAEACNARDDNCNGVIDEPGACPCATRHFGGHVYQFCTNVLSWTNARDQCVAAGYRLATIETAAENTALFAAAMSVADEDWWIGYNDRATDMTWVWQSGISSSYAEWGSGQPSGPPPFGAEQDCALITDGSEDYETRGEWNDTNCDDEHRFVCEAGP
jgi:hypothetical protein